MINRRSSLLLAGLLWLAPPGCNKGPSGAPGASGQKDQDQRIDSAQRSGAPFIDSAQRSGAPFIDSAQRSGAPFIDNRGASRSAIEISQVDDGVKSVYPTDKVVPVAAAERLCDTLQALQERRRAECCGGAAGLVVTSECVRMLSAALQARAVKLEAAAVAACAAAMEQALAGCEWVGPWPPSPPAACLGLIRGTLPDRARCRSSLECAEGRYCHGVGPLSPGTCGPPGADDEVCGGSVDPLATYARQDDFEVAHPECQGYCNRGRCAAPVPLGGACTFGGPCGRGRHCAGGRCAEGAQARVGEECSSGGCEAGARCVGGRCVVPRAEGQSCGQAQECRGTCVLPDGGQRGVCRHDCRKR